MFLFMYLLKIACVSLLLRSLFYEFAEVDDALVNSESPDTLGDIDEDGK